MRPCRNKNDVASKTHQKSKPNYDQFGRREDRLHFIAQMLCLLYGQYVIFKNGEALAKFNHIVRYVIDPFFGQNNRPGSKGLKSLEAHNIIMGRKKGTTINEHVVPMSVIQANIKKIVNNHGASSEAIEEIENFLKRNAFIVRISTKEDKRLKNKGLYNKMPDGWKDGDSPWKRYSDAEIVVVDNKGNKIGLDKTALNKKGRSSSMVVRKVRTAPKVVRETGMSRNHCKKGRQ